MRNKKNRKSDITVNVLDLEQVLEEAYKKIKEEDPDAWKIAGIRPLTKLASVETDEGIFIIDSEGVGDGEPLSEENKLEIPVYPEYEDSFGIFPIVIISLTQEEVHNLPIKETLNLKDFIRSFGSRLEQNFELWNQKLSCA